MSYKLFTKTQRKPFDSESDLTRSFGSKVLIYILNAFS